MVIEQTINRPDAATAAHLLLKGGQIEKASRSYSRAIEADPQLNDPELAGILQGPKSVAGDQFQTLRQNLWVRMEFVGFLQFPPGCLSGKRRRLAMSRKIEVGHS